MCQPQLLSGVQHERDSSQTNGRWWRRVSNWSRKDRNDLPTASRLSLSMRERQKWKGLPTDSQTAARSRGRPEGVSGERSVWFAASHTSSVAHPLRNATQSALGKEPRPRALGRWEGGR